MFSVYEITLLASQGAIKFYGEKQKVRGFSDREFFR